MLAELLGPILRWPLHSPRRLAAVLATLVVLLVVIAGVTGNTGNTGGATTIDVADPVPTPLGETTAGPGDSPTPGPWTGHPVDPVDLTDPPSHDGSDAALDAGGTAEAQTVAVLFATRWARPGLPADQWLAGLTDVSDPAYLEQLANTDPARVPAAAVSGPAEAIVTGAYYAQYLVPTDAGDLTIRVTYDGTSWRVVSISPLVPGPPTAGTG